MELRLQPDDARKVLENPAIFDTVSEDGMVDVVLPENRLYLCGYVPDLVGCFILHKQCASTLECHVQVLPEYRPRYATDFGRAVIEWTWANTDAEKLVAQIPFLYPNVRDFAMKMGFQDEGVNRRSYRKNGKLWNQWHMGLCKGDE